VAAPKRPPAASARHRPGPTRLTQPTGPLATVAAYWRSIERHAFANAYTQLLPGAVGMTEAEFIAYEQNTQVESVRFSGRAVSGAGSPATVAVDALVTQDRRLGCQSWSGSYQLTYSAARWRIARAAITPRSCGT
jgi:hypothetical protein